MTEKVFDFTTFPKTFESYKWYKPLLVLIITVIMYFVFTAILVLAFGQSFGWESMMMLGGGGYEILNTEMGQIFTDLGVIILLPSLFIATKIVRDRPFSSYSSSRGGWNFTLYFKALVIPLLMYIVFEAICIPLLGAKGTYHFTIGFLLICIILVPLQCIAEEYIFRGLAMQMFGSWFGIPVLAVVLQAIFFAVVHSYNTLGVISILISGILFGVLAWKSNGLEVSSAVHTANNFIISLTVMLGLETSSSTIPLTDTIISIAFNILLFAVMYYIIEKTEWLKETKG